MSTPHVTLTSDQVLQLRSELQRTLTRIERGMKTNGNGHAPREIDQSAVGRLSRIEAIQNQGLTRTLHDRERSQLSEVMAALERLDAGSYGVCDTCRTVIQFERLVVFPEARTCGGCSAN